MAYLPAPSTPAARTVPLSGVQIQPRPLVALTAIAAPPPAPPATPSVGYAHS